MNGVCFMNTWCPSTSTSSRSSCTASSAVLQLHLKKYIWTGTWRMKQELSCSSACHQRSKLDFIRRCNVSSSLCIIPYLFLLRSALLLWSGSLICCLMYFLLLWERRIPGLLRAIMEGYSLIPFFCKSPGGASFVLRFSVRSLNLIDGFFINGKRVEFR